eukprot:IDg10096t1
MSPAIQCARKGQKTTANNTQPGKTSKGRLSQRRYKAPAVVTPEYQRGSAELGYSAPNAGFIINRSRCAQGS